MYNPVFICMVACSHGVTVKSLPARLIPSSFLSEESYHRFESLTLLSQVTATFKNIYMYFIN